MKKISVELEGQTPLLMNSPASMLLQANLKSKLTAPDPVAEADKKAYKMEDGTLYVPATAIMGTMLNGASFKKAGKYALKSILAGNVAVQPEQISLGTKKYEIDIRTAVIRQGARKNRIIVARPKIPKWKLNFTIVYNDQFIADPNNIKACLEDAGFRIGILDFRPQNSGSFGTFKVTKFYLEK